MVLMFWMVFLPCQSSAFVFFSSSCLCLFYCVPSFSMLLPCFQWRHIPKTAFSLPYVVRSIFQWRPSVLYIQLHIHPIIAAPFPTVPPSYLPYDTPAYSSILSNVDIYNKQKYSFSIISISIRTQNLGFTLTCLVYRLFSQSFKTSSNRSRFERCSRPSIPTFHLPLWTDWEYFTVLEE